MSNISIVKQEFPETPRPYRLIETYHTTEGTRTRVCFGVYTTYDDACFERAKLLLQRDGEAM